MEHHGFEPQVGALLRMAWEAVQVELLAGLRAAGFDDLREVHRPLLRYPSIDGLRPTDLATLLRLSKQATNDLIRDMERMNYIRLDRDPSDGRARVIRYTARGWGMFELGSELSRRVGQRWAHAIGEKRYEQFEAALRAIVDLDVAPSRPLLLPVDQRGAGAGGGVGE